MFIEELFFSLIEQSFLIEEAIEGGVCIFEGVLLHEELVVLSSFVSVGEDFESFSDIVELGFGSFAMLFVFVGVPL